MRTLSPGRSAVIAAGILLLAGCGSASDVSGDTTPESGADSSSTPSPSAPSPSATPAPSGPTFLPSIPMPDLPDGVGIVTLGEGEEHDVTETGVTAVRCEGGGEVTVRAAATVTTLGQCEEVAVTGDGANVGVLATDELSVSGDGNRVAVGDVREIDVEGDGNTVLFRGSPETDVTGDGNHVAGIG